MAITPIETYRVARVSGGTRRKALFEAARPYLLNERGDNRRVGITWAQWIGNDKCPYMCRWVLNLGLGSLRVHRWLASDDDRALHDHPWWFLTFVLKGGYTDISSSAPQEQHGHIEDRQVYSGIRHDHLRRGSIRYRPARHAHTVQVDPGGECWTVMLTGRHTRDWGFWVDGVWKRMRRYFREHGHHPCD